MRIATAVLATLLTTAAAAPGIAHATAPDRLPQSISDSAPAQGVVAYPPEFFAAVRPTTAYDMVQRLPGFSFDSGAQVRGFAGAAGNVLIDGERPTSKQDDLGQALSRIPASQVVRIDVIRGGAPGIDMQGRTIMANVIVKHNGGAQAVLAASDKVSVEDGRNLPGFDAEWSQRTGDRKFEAAFNVGGFVDDGSGNGPHIGTDGAGDPTYSAHLWTHAGGEQSTLTSAYEQPLAGGKFRINGLLQLTDYIDHERDTQSIPTGNDDVYKDSNGNLNGEIGVHYSRDLGPKLALEALAIQQASHYQEHAHYAATGFDEVFGIDNLGGESIVRSTLRYTALPTLTLETALEGAYNTQTTKTDFLINSVSQPLPAANEQVAETRGDAGFTATWTPSGRYTVEAGLRVEDSSVIASGDVKGSKSLFYPKPRIVFTWSPDAKDQVRLRFEREVGQLDFGAFSASGSLNAGGVHAGNPRVLPPQSWVIEGAFERRFWDGGDATLTLRHADITDPVDRIAGMDPITGPFDEGGNLPHGTENDLVFDITIPLDKFGWKGAQLKTTETWRSTRVIDPTTLTARPQTQVHPLDMEAHFTQDLPWIKSNLGVDYANGYMETDYRFNEIDYVHFAPRYVVFFEYKPTPNLRIKLQGINLLSQGLQRTIATYSSPRAPGALASAIDYRNQQFGPLVYLSVRRTF